MREDGEESLMRTPDLGTLARGIVAGLAGTAVMTAAQMVVQKARSRSKPPADEERNAAPRWADAPAPAKVARKIAHVFGVDPSRDRIPLLTNVMHWGYGISLGTAYSIADRRPRSHPLLRGIGFGLGAWAAAYAELVPLGIYKPPWRYDVKTLATEGSYHVTYGVAVAGAAAALARR